MLAKSGDSEDLACPITSEPPPGGILIGRMPKYLRNAFVKSHELRQSSRSEAEIFEEALSELLQEHFRKVLAGRKRRGEPPVGQFYLVKDWQVYATSVVQ
jgi:hypothetical protein